jgi:hypothetical protein
MEPIGAHISAALILVYIQAIQNAFGGQLTVTRVKFEAAFTRMKSVVGLTPLQAYVDLQISIRVGRSFGR